MDTARTFLHATIVVIASISSGLVHTAAGEGCRVPTQTYINRTGCVLVPIGDIRTRTSLVFHIKGNPVATVALAQSPNINGSAVMVRIGRKQGNVKNRKVSLATFDSCGDPGGRSRVHDQHSQNTDLLSSLEFRSFWLQWKAHELRMGKGSTVGQDLLLLYDSFSMSDTVGALFLAGSWKSSFQAILEAPIAGCSTLSASQSVETQSHSTPPTGPSAVVAVTFSAEMSNAVFPNTVTVSTTAFAPLISPVISPSTVAGGTTDLGSVDSMWFRSQTTQTVENTGMTRSTESKHTQPAHATEITATTFPTHFGDWVGGFGTSNNFEGSASISANTNASTERKTELADLKFTDTNTGGHFLVTATQRYAGSISDYESASTDAFLSPVSVETSFTQPASNKFLASDPTAPIEHPVVMATESAVGVSLVAAAVLDTNSELLPVSTSPTHITLDSSGTAGIVSVSEDVRVTTSLTAVTTTETIAGSSPVVTGDTVRKLFPFSAHDSIRHPSQSVHSAATDTITGQISVSPADSSIHLMMSSVPVIESTAVSFKETSIETFPQALSPTIDTSTDLFSTTIPATTAADFVSATTSHTRSNAFTSTVSRTAQSVILLNAISTITQFVYSSTTLVHPTASTLLLSGSVSSAELLSAPPPAPSTTDEDPFRSTNNGHPCSDVTSPSPPSAIPQTSSPPTSSLPPPSVFKSPCTCNSVQLSRQRSLVNDTRSQTEQQNIEKAAENIRTNLILPTSNLSRVVRSKTSIWDSRPSSVMIGVVGVVICVVPVLLVILSDVQRLLAHLSGAAP